MGNPDQVKKTRDAAIELRGMSVEALLESPRWGALSFRDVAADIRLSISLGTHLGDLPIEIIPTNPANDIAIAAANALEALKNVAAFDLESGPNPRDQRDTFAAAVRTTSLALLNASQGWIPFLAYQKGDVQKNIGDLSRAVADATKALDAANTYATVKKGEVDEIIGAAREASAKVGVGHFTEDFAGEARRLDVEAKRWLRVTSGLAGLTLVIALALTLVSIPVGASGAEVAHLVSSKIIVLVVLLTATVWCGRLYKATKHQAVMNHHRSNSLKTFQAFIKAATDVSTRDAVLMETTRSIFSVGPSGYLDAGDSAIEPASKLMEIIRAPRTAS